MGGSCTCSPASQVMFHVTFFFISKKITLKFLLKCRYWCFIKKNFIVSRKQMLPGEKQRIFKAIMRSMKFFSIILSILWKYWEILSGIKTQMRNELSRPFICKINVNGLFEFINFSSGWSSQDDCPILSMTDRTLKIHKI